MGTDVGVCVTGYFNMGLGITEAIRHHQHILQLDDDFCDSWLADASRYPKYRTVEYWHSKWRMSNLGPRTGVGMIEVSLQVFCISWTYLHNLKSKLR